MLLRGDLTEETPQSVLTDPARLRSVARLGIGSRGDAAFDRIAVLVERLVDVPVALVTVLGADRQFLPGQVGLPGPLADGREMGLGHSFSRHVVEAGEALIVPDVREVPVLRDNLSIRDLGTISYAGVPLTDSDGLVLGTLAVMDREPRNWTASEIALLTDLGEVCSSELRLRIAREVADEARRHAESAHDQLALLGELTETLAATMDMDEALSRLGQLVAGRLADWCFVALVDQSGQVRHVSAAHSSPAYASDARRLAALAGTSAADVRTLIGKVQRTGRLIRHDVADPENLGNHLATKLATTKLATANLNAAEPANAKQATKNLDTATQATGEPVAGKQKPTAGEAATGKPVTGELAALAQRMGFASCLIVPITDPANRRILGAVMLVNGPGRAPFGESEEQAAAEVGRRAGLAVDNSRLYRHQRHVAEVLQHSMLPELPTISGIDLHARYLPAQAGAAVGGDWYDAFAQPDGSVMLAVGDVSGHDIEAAATMGQVRNLVRGDAYGRADAPGPLLAQLDRALHGLGVPAAATAVLARVHRDGDGYDVTFANAGHPPPVLLNPDGEVDVWWEDPEPLLGLVPRDLRTTHRRRVRPGSTLLLYTDGLVENPACLIDEGIARVSEVLRGNAALPAEELCSRLVDSAPRRADDIALLVVCLR